MSSANLENEATSAHVSTPTVDTYLRQCFFSYPNNGTTLQPGQSATFKVVLPSIPNAEVDGAVEWKLTDNTGVPLPRSDYRILNGGLNDQLLTVVFRPVASRIVNVQPVMNLFYSLPPGPAVGPVSSTFAKIPYTLEGIGPTELATIKGTLEKMITLRAPETLIEPGEAAQLEIATKSAADVLAVATEILHEAPQVNLRGAVSLAGLVEAIFSALSSIFTSSLPGIGEFLDFTNSKVSDLVSTPVSIPLALDQLGSSVTTRLTPRTASPVPTFTTTPQQNPASGALEGVIPVGDWQSSMRFVSATWVLSTTDGTALKYGDLTPHSTLIKLYLIQPSVVSLSGPVAPREIYVDVRVTFEVDSESVVIDLPRLTLLFLPLVLPHIAVGFTRAFYDFAGKGQYSVVVVPDDETAPLLPAAQNFINLVGRLRTALDSIVTASNILNLNWTELGWLATAIGTIVDQTARAAPGNIYVAPAPTVPESVATSGWHGNDLQGTDFDDALRGIVYLNPYGFLKKEDANRRHLIVGDPNDTKNYVEFLRDSTSYYSAMIGGFPGEFTRVIQVPPNTVTASDNGKNYDKRLEGFAFVKRG